MSRFKYAVIYTDNPRPKWWRHPIKWWKWEQPIIGWVDLENDFEDEEGDLTITWWKEPA